MLPFRLDLKSCTKESIYLLFKNTKDDFKSCIKKDAQKGLNGLQADEKTI